MKSLMLKHEDEIEGLTIGPLFCVTEDGYVPAADCPEFDSCHRILVRSQSGWVNEDQARAMAKINKVELTIG